MRREFWRWGVLLGALLASGVANGAPADTDPVPSGATPDESEIGSDGHLPGGDGDEPGASGARRDRASFAAALRAAASAVEPVPDSPLRIDAPDFEITMRGLMQYRYTVSAAPQAPGSVSDPSIGFGFRRLRNSIRAKALDGKLSMLMQAESALGRSILLDAWVAFDINDHLRFRLGRYNLQFEREIITSSSRLLAVDRSALANTLNTDAANRVEGLELMIHDQRQRLFLSFNEGLGVTFSRAGDERADWGVTARYERMLIGDGFTRSNEFTAPRGTPRGLRLGTAVHTQHLYTLGSRFAAAFDLTYRENGFNAMISLGTQVAEDRNGPLFEEPEHDWGMVLQSGYYITDKLEPFIRSEFGTTSDEMHPDLAIVTTGFNYYIYGQAFKFSTDLSVAFDGVGPAFDRRGDGLLQTPEGNNRYVFHAQLQLLF